MAALCPKSYSSLTSFLLSVLATLWQATENMVAASHKCVAPYSDTRLMFENEEVESYFSEDTDVTVQDPDYIPMDEAGEQRSTEVSGHFV
jgi:hypothetical protein